MAKSEGRVHHPVSGKITRFVVTSFNGIDQDAVTFIRIRKKMSNDKRESVATHRESAKRNLIDALRWVSSSDMQELSRWWFCVNGTRRVLFSRRNDVGGTMSGKSTTTFAYYDKTLPADDKNAYLAVVSLIHNYRRHNSASGQAKNPLFDEFAPFDNAWTRHKQALKDPTCRFPVHAVIRSLYERLST